MSRNRSDGGIWRQNGDEAGTSIAGGQDLNIGGETEDLIGASAAPLVYPALNGTMHTSTYSFRVLCTIQASCTSYECFYVA